MTGESVSVAVIAAVIAFAVEVIPQVKGLWDRLNEKQKQAIVLAAAFIVGLVTAILQCAVRGICPADWLAVIETLIANFVAGIIGATSAHYSVRKIVQKPQVGAFEYSD